jgi:hypothetical protein
MIGQPIVVLLLLFLTLFVFYKLATNYFLCYSVRLVVVGLVFYCFGLLGVIAYCLYFSLRELKASFAVKDTVTSRISSAAQGYVEIIGKSSKETGLKAPLSGLPCLWYEYSEYENKSIWPNWMAGSKDWKLISSGSYHDPFVLSDGTSSCQVNPLSAQISGLDCRNWYEGKRRCHELLLLANKDVYVLGEFITIGEEVQKAKANKEVSALINAWKQNPNVLKASFDINNDGEIDLQEMALIRTRAQREVEQKAAIKIEPVNTINKPKDKRPFVISHHPHSTLVNRHRLHGLYYLVIGLFLLSQTQAYCTGLVFNSMLCQKVMGY